jgi:hypothetical protein
MKTKVRRSAGILILLVSLAILLWSVWPFGRQSRQVAVAAGEMRLAPVVGVTPAADSTAASDLAVPDARLLRLEWPVQMRIGDSAVISLVFEMDQQGQITPTVLADSPSPPGAPAQIVNVYETYRVIVEANLEMAGMEYRPEGVISEALLPGSGVKFIWSVRPSETGAYHGTIWLHLRFIPLNGGEEIRNVLTAQRMTIAATSLWGMSGPTALGVGCVGTIIGVLLGLDFVLEWLLKLASKPKRLEKSG